jgi:hypothetical protein
MYRLAYLILDFCTQQNEKLDQTDFQEALDRKKKLLNLYMIKIHR